jgi:glycosyltransferase involved in cell wall biosynthesis
MFDLEIPLFSIRRGFAAGLASAIYNLIAGLTALKKTIGLPYTAKQRLNPEFISLEESNNLVAFCKYPMIPGGMATRFVEEVIYANMPHKSAHILYPNYFMPLQLLKGRAKVSVIIHDCQHHVFPGFFSSQKRLWLDANFRKTLRHADCVFLISEFERGQIARFYGESLADRCCVIYNAIDWRRYDEGVVSSWALQAGMRPYILCVGHQYPHKNTLKVAKAYLKLLDRNEDLDLIIVGRISDEVKLFVENSVPERIRHKIVLAGHISDADVGHFYKHARLFVSASSYEGFGMPAVEAMGFAVPVLVTHTASLPEVTLGKATYCEDGGSAEVWAEAISHCLEHTRTPNEYQVLAEEVRKRYAPAIIAAALLERIKSA